LAQEMLGLGRFWCPDLPGDQEAHGRARPSHHELEEERP
jgi:hypothetical protein